MAVTKWTKPANAVRLLAASAVLAAALSALAVAERAGRFTTYAGTSAAAACLTVAAECLLVAAAVVVYVTRAPFRIGDLALVAAFVWSAPVWVGWQDGPPLVRSAGMILAAFTFPVLVHIVLVDTRGRAVSTPARALVALGYTEAAIAAILLAAVRDPYFDPGCWSNCTVNSFLVRSMPSIAHAIQTADRWFAVALAAAVAVVLAWRLAAATAPARSEAVPVALPAIVLCASVAARAIALQATPLEDPTNVVFVSIFAAQCAAVILVAGGVAATAIHARARRQAVSRTVASLGEVPPPGSVQAALARALGDPELRIAYWLPSSERFVDANGAPVDEPAAGPGRVVTTLVRDGAPIAVVSHAGTLPELEREIGPAVTLGLENERLQAEVLAQLEEIRASRARIVETGDAERRRLERDLHDGAQQRLLALSFEIQSAGAAAAKGGDATAQLVLDRAVRQTRTALAELRELAHGIFPAILAQAGVAAALEALADSAPVRVELRDVAEGRLPTHVEMASYVLVTEAVDDAVARGARKVVIDMKNVDSTLILAVDDDGSPRTSSTLAAADRVGAVGGTLEVEQTAVRAEMPSA